MSAATQIDWDESAGSSRFPLHDDQRTPEACEECADSAAKLARAHALLRAIRRMDAKPSKPNGLDDDPLELAVIAAAVLQATINARIDLYFGKVRS
jgi:hypothetical protein